MITPVLLSGGFGTRLWPISRKSNPKQFVHDLFDETLFSKALTITSNANIFLQPLIVSNKEHKFFIKDEIISRQASGIILEPQSKNTAASIALAAFALQEDDTPMLVMPSDHLISDKSLFEESVQNALSLTKDYMITFGVKPTFPSTGYGYIKIGKTIDNGFIVEKFHEKPDKQTAQQFIDTGSFFWNAGIFLVKPSIYLNALKEFLPNTFKIAEAIMNQYHSGEINIESEPFCDLENISVDYAILEKIANVAVCPMLSPWNDVGGFASLAEQMPHDVEHNAIKGDVASIDTKDCTIIGTNRLIATIGITNLTIVDTGDALLVAHNDRLQDVKAMVQKIESRKEAVFDTKVYRPWGYYEVLKESHDCKVKKIYVKPHCRLSMQSHKFRSEHWVVISGEATVHNDNNIIILKRGEATFIHAQAKHRLTNDTELPVIIIETQIGTYLGEDDIIRYDDIYGRN